MRSSKKRRDGSWTGDGQEFESYIDPYLSIWAIWPQISMISRAGVLMYSLNEDGREKRAHNSDA